MDEDDDSDLEGKSWRKWLLVWVHRVTIEALAGLLGGVVTALAIHWSKSGSTALLLDVSHLSVRAWTLLVIGAAGLLIIGLAWRRLRQ